MHRLFKIHSSLNYAKSHVGSETSLDLKLKPLETLFCVIPHLYNIYNKNSQNNSKEFMNHLLYHCELNYVIVSNIYDKDSKSRTSKHLRLLNSFKSVNRLKPCVFKKIERFNPSQYLQFVERNYHQNLMFYLIKEELGKFLEDYIEDYIHSYDSLALIPHYLY